MGVDVFSKSRSDQQVAPVGFRESNCISKSIEIATTQLEGSKAKAVHSSDVQILKKRQVISTFFEEDLPCTILISRSKKQSQTPFGFRTELRCAHHIIIAGDVGAPKSIGGITPDSPT
jgi:hypothetical protein